ncbi:MAG: hypothetical protein ACFFBJ_12940, partial [Promethearchaeota archaeon]
AVHFGLLALRDFGTVKKIDWIDKRFQSFENEVEKAFDEAQQKLDDYLGEKGELDRKFSDVDGPIRSILDPYTETSPFYDLRRDLEEEFNRVRDLISREAGREEADEVGTRKGVKFEDELLDFLEPICSKMGDRIKKISTRKVAGRKVGDLLIEVNEKHLPKTMNIVIEAKAGPTRIGGKAGLIKQLDDAIGTRKAHYALGVVKVQNGLKGVDGCFSHIGENKVLCTFEPDGVAVEVAYRFARAEILLQASGETIIDSPTCTTVSEKLSEITTKLKEFNNTKSHLTNIETSTTEIRKAIGNLQRDITEILSYIEALIRVPAKSKPEKKSKKTSKKKS